MVKCELATTYSMMHFVVAILSDQAIMMSGVLLKVAKKKSCTNKQIMHVLACNGHINTLDQSQIFTQTLKQQNIFLIKCNSASLSHPEVILEVSVEKRHKISCFHGG